MNADSPKWVRISTDSVLPERQWDAWRDLASNNYDVVAKTERAQGYRLDYVSFERGPLVLSHYQRDPAISIRTRQRIHGSDSDWFFVQMFLAGETFGNLDGVDYRGGTDGILVMDMARPVEVHGTGTEVVALSVRRDEMERLTQGVEPPHGFAPSSILAEVLKDHLVSVMRHASSIGPDDAHRLSDATNRLLRAALVPSRDGLMEAEPEIAIGLLRRAKAYIQRELLSPEISPDRIAREIGVSRRKLYQLFEADGGVARYIQCQRLERARAALSRPGAGYRVKTAAFDHGFTSEAHFSRSFKRLFGFSAREAAEAAGRPIRVR